MRKLYTYILKTGDSIIFMTDMPEVEVKTLPTFPNQHKFYSYIQDKGYKLNIELIIKKAP